MFPVFFVDVSLFKILIPLLSYIIILLYVKNKFIRFLIFTPILFINLLELGHFFIYKSYIPTEFFLIYLNTNRYEFIEVLGSLGGLKSVLIVFIIILFIVSVFKLIIPYNLKKNKTNIFYFFIFILILKFLLTLYAVKDPTSKKIFTKHTFRKTIHTIAKETYPLHPIDRFRDAVIFLKISYIYVEKSKMNRIGLVKNNLTNTSKTVVLVMGESARVMNHSLFGYHRQTNPLLEKRKNLIKFTNFYAESNNTFRSLTFSLSNINARNYEDLLINSNTLINGFNELGFETFTITNQYKSNSLFDLIEMNQSNYYINVNRRGQHLDKNVIKPFDSVLKLKSKNKLILVHLMGSHNDYKERYPSEFSTFKPDKVINYKKENLEAIVNSYDNSISYTDYVLDQLISSLKKQNKETIFFYFSDHGENLFDTAQDLIGHAYTTSNKYELKIPFFVWYSNKYFEKNKDLVNNMDANNNKLLNTSYLFNSTLNSFGSSIDSVFLEKSILSDKCKPLIEVNYLSNENVGVQTLSIQ